MRAGDVIGRIQDVTALGRSLLSLPRWPDQEAMPHIHLLCVADLQRTLDVKFTTGQWQALSAKDAVDAIGKIVFRASNQAVRCSDLFSVCQAIKEPASAFFVRCAQRPWIVNSSDPCVSVTSQSICSCVK